MCDTSAWIARHEFDYPRVQPVFARYKSFARCASPYALKCPPLDMRADVCSTIRSAVFVGDSTAAEQFVSFVELVGGRVSAKNRQAKTVISGIRAHACDGNLTLDFIRSDFLALTLHVHAKMKRLFSTIALQAETFSCRMSRAALLVIGTGHHFAAAQSRNSTLTLVFQAHIRATLQQIVAKRARLGHAPNTIALYGVRFPVPNCITKTNPLRESFALPTWHAHYGWHVYGANDRFLQTMADENNLSFVDIHASASMRPDSALAHAYSANTKRQDCLHQCLPGPADSWNRDMWLRLRVRNFSNERGPTATESETSC